jgi:protein-S-isoprenylcysteine O-methyltransferase Ste14
MGLLLMFMAVVLADWGRISRGVIAPSKEMPQEYSLSTEGAYGMVRHPLYLSYDLFFVGLPLALLNPWLCILLPGIYGYYRVAEVEEEMLVSRFGDLYQTYQQQVGMFIPRWRAGK